MIDLSLERFGYCFKQEALGTFKTLINIIETKAMTQVAALLALSSTVLTTKTTPLGHSTIKLQNARYAFLLKAYP